MIASRPQPDSPHLIPGRDAEGLVRLLEAAPGVRRRYQFFVWMQTHVHLLLPHAVAVCGAYRRQWRDLEFEAFHGVLLDEAAVGQFSGAASVPMTQIVDHWQRQGGGPSTIALTDLCDAAAAGQGSAWQALVASGLGHVLVHGVTRPDRPSEVESLFAFVHAGRAPLPERFYYLELLLPHLHSVYLRVRAMERELGSNAVRPHPASPARPLARWNVTERELEILRWVREGRSNQQIGEQLGISALTVKNHIQKILRKMQASNRAQAVSLAITAGLLRDGQPPEPG